MRIDTCCSRIFSRSALFIAVVLLSLGSLAPLTSASAYTLKTLHSFCSWTNCNDGENPSEDGGIRDSAGNIYGTTEFGGKYNNGVVFKLVLTAGIWKESVLKNFCAQPSCADGQRPQNDLTLDTNGSLYGTTFSGGKFGFGNIFRLTPNGNGWTYSVLHSFCRHSGCPDGSNPASGLAYAGRASGQPWNGSSPLYGVTVGGGQYGNGIAFQFVHNGSSWIETNIHSFQTAYYPTTPIVDGAGNIYGTTQGGGKYSGGNLYKLAQGTWTQTVLHNFCSAANCTDGDIPGTGPLVMDTVGNLFGVTQEGGAHSNSTVCNGDHTCGVVFEYSINGTYSVRYSFCAAANCSDGSVPIGGLTIDSMGHLFGLTSSGGLGENDGVAFSLVDVGGTWTESVLYDFCSLANCADGQSPEGPLSVDASGNLWGLAAFGATNFAGTAFELTNP